jgi:hypothetical protein
MLLRCLNLILAFHLPGPYFSLFKINKKICEFIAEFENIKTSPLSFKLREKIIKLSQFHAIIQLYSLFYRSQSGEPFWLAIQGATFYVNFLHKTV